MTSVLDDISSGRLHIPRFQRPLVWKWAQRREFFDSIFEGLPIGALMIWISEGDPISTYESLGPHKLPPPKGGAEVRYLMDGVQRVSTLYGALRAHVGWEDYDEVEEIEVEDFVVYADLDCTNETETERFVRRIDVGSRIDADRTRYLPLSIVLESRDLLRFQRDVPAGKEHRVDAADEVASAFRQYKIPLITLNSTSLEIVTKSFERINSRGADMSELHMLNALTYSDSFDLLKRDREFRRKYLAPVNWEDLDSDVILRCIKMRVGADIYTKNPDEVARRLKGDEAQVETVFRSLARTGEFLKSAMGISSPSLVPYRMQLVGLSSVLFEQDWSSIRRKLEDWMWLTTYTEVFGLSARQSENAVRDLQTYVRSDDFRWSLRDPPAVRGLRDLRTDFRSARVKAFAFALAFRQDIDSNDSGGKALLTNFGREAFVPIAIEGVDGGKAGCRFLIDPADVVGFRHRLLSGGLSERELSVHLISEEASEALARGWYDHFADVRAESIFDFEIRQILRPLASRLDLTVTGINDETLLN